MGELKPNLLPTRMSLRTYLTPDFKFVEVRCEHRYCGAELSARGGVVGVSNEEVEGFDAAGYRGLWDEEETESGDRIWG